MSELVSRLLERMDSLADDLSEIIEENDDFGEDDDSLRLLGLLREVHRKHYTRFREPSERLAKSAGDLLFACEVALKRFTEEYSFGPHRAILASAIEKATGRKADEDMIK